MSGDRLHGIGRHPVGAAREVCRHAQCMVDLERRGAPPAKRDRGDAGRHVDVARVHAPRDVFECDTGRTGECHAWSAASGSSNRATAQAATSRASTIAIWAWPIGAASRRGRRLQLQQVLHQEGWPQEAEPQAALLDAPLAAPVRRRRCWCGAVRAKRRRAARDLDDPLHARGIRRVEGAALEQVLVRSMGGQQEELLGAIESPRAAMRGRAGRPQPPAAQGPRGPGSARAHEQRRRGRRARPRRGEPIVPVAPRTAIMPAPPLPALRCARRCPRLPAAQPVPGAARRVRRTRRRSDRAAAAPSRRRAGPATGTASSLTTCRPASRQRILSISRARDDRPTAAEALVEPVRLREQRSNRPLERQPARGAGEGAGAVGRQRLGPPPDPVERAGAIEQLDRRVAEAPHDGRGGLHDAAPAHREPLHAPHVRTALGLIAVEQPLRRAAKHGVELPRQVAGVARARGEALTGERRRQVRGVAGQQHAPDAPALGRANVEGVDDARARTRRSRRSTHGSSSSRMRAGSRNGAGSSPGWSIHSQRWRPGDIGSETAGRSDVADRNADAAPSPAAGRSTSASTTSQRCANVDPPNGILQAAAHDAARAVASDEVARAERLGPTAGSRAAPRPSTLLGAVVDRLDAACPSAARPRRARPARRPSCAPSKAGGSTRAADGRARPSRCGAPRNARPRAVTKLTAGWTCASRGSASSTPGGLEDAQHLVVDRPPRAAASYGSSASSTAMARTPRSPSSSASSCPTGPNPQIRTSQSHHAGDRGCRASASR